MRHCNACYTRALFTEPDPAPAALICCMKTEIPALLADDPAHLTMSPPGPVRAIRNIAIIAHVDHGKTTLVDKLLRQSGTFAAHQHLVERVMDSNDLERERGITILAKNCAVDYEGTHINIVDTPGHADFGGEVERVLSMVDGVLLLVDAVEGPMPQTRFVTRKALALGLKPIVVVNKVDRPGARAEWVVNHTFDLFDKLGATEEQMDFPVVYASALQGWAVTDLRNAPLPPSQPLSRAERGASSPSSRSERSGDEGFDMKPLFEAILRHVPVRADDPDGPLQLQLCSLDYSSYVGRIGIGRINRGRIRSGQQVAVLRGPDSTPVMAKVNQVLVFKGLERVVTEEALAGDIVAVNGIEEVGIGVTLNDPEHLDALPLLKVDEPTLVMNFQVNTSPFAGREGRFVTSRQLRERLMRETMGNVALRVEDTGDADVFKVSGRGELHLTILLENMRREGYELAVSRPRVVVKEIGGVKHEPFEMLAVDIEETHQGAVMEALGARRGDLQEMQPDGKGRVRLDYRIPARGLIGFQSDFLTMTRGTGVMSHVFDDYAPLKPEITERRNGVLVSAETGEAVAYALWKLQERGRMFVNPGEPLYEGMVVGLHSRDNDLVVNPVKTKQLTNIRAAGKDEAILLTPPIRHTLESAVEFIADDELVEITPQSIRIRKRLLLENERRRTRRAEQVHAA
jgi:GTP-binding protein